MLQPINQLSAEQLNELKDFLQLCKDHDGNVIPVYDFLLTLPRPHDSTILYYEDGKLAGFLSGFFFYEKACEIALLIHPQKRKQGLGFKLLTGILPLLNSLPIETLVFTTIPNKLNAWLTKQGFQYQKSEYAMLRDKTTPCAEIKNPLQIRVATEADLDALLNIDVLCFPPNDYSPYTPYENLVVNPEYTLLLVELEGEAIGKAHINWLPECARLSDIGILPKFQGQGYGTHLLIFCIRYILEKGITNLQLDVETNNQNALKLYTNVGFSPTNACDYWTISLQQFANLLDAV